MKSFEWADARTIPDAIALLGDDKDATVKAGGVDLVDLMKERIAQPSRVVNIRNVPGLDQIESDGKTVRVGPLVTLTKLSEDRTVRQQLTALADAAAHAATPQVRNMATVGGNLLQRPRCWYFRHESFPCRKKGGERCFAQDGENQYHAIFNNGLCAIVHPSAAACALVALGAKLELTAEGDERREVLLEEFLTPPTVNLHRENALRPNELVTRIIVPVPQGGARSAYTKQGEKESFDWPIAEVAVVLAKDGDTCRSASVVLGAAAPVPHRAKAAEDALVGKKIDATTVAAAASAALKDATPMSQNGYKLPVFDAIIARTIMAAAGTGGAAGGGA